MVWNFESINKLITDKVEENKHLEYKGSDSLGSSEGRKKEISKDISAFANSDGGVIIYGMKEFDEKDKNNLPEKIDPINRQEYSKEWLENIITGNISPVLHDIKITPVPVNADNTLVVYIVEIEKGNTAHQANDFRYYRRHNFKAIPMEDWEVKDIMNRSNKPVIIPTIRGYIHEDNIVGEELAKYEIQLILKNTGNMAIQHIECYLEFDKELYTYFKTPSPLQTGSKIQIAFDNRKEHKIVIGTKETVISTSHTPLLPQVWREIGVAKLRRNIFEKDGTFKCIVATEYGANTTEHIIKETVVKPAQT